MLSKLTIIKQRTTHPLSQEDMRQKFTGVESVNYSWFSTLFFQMLLTIRAAHLQSASKYIHLVPASKRHALSQMSAAKLARAPSISLAGNMNCNRASRERL